MSADLRLLIAVSPVLLEDFVGESAVRQLSESFGKVERIDPTRVGTQAWQGRIATFKPHAIMTGWGTPAVPAGAIPPLKLVAHTGGGVRSLVTRPMIEAGLQVVNWGDEAAPSVAEHALLLILAAQRRLTAWTLDLHERRGWRQDNSNFGRGLYGRRVGLHGFGGIARHLVRLLKPFDCKIAAYSAGVPAEIFTQHGVRQAESLESLFEQADVLVEVEALNPTTRGSVTEKMLRRLPPGSTFISVGRGAVIDQAALERVAAEGSLQVAMDVFAVEPLPADSPLRGLANVTLTPHIAGPTADRRRQCGARAVESLLRFVRGESQVDVVTPEVYDRST